MVSARFGMGGELETRLRDTLPTSIDCDLLLAVESSEGSGWNAARCRDSIEPLSSMGVKMLLCCFLAVGSFFTSVVSSGGWTGRSSCAGSGFMSIGAGGGS